MLGNSTFLATEQGSVLALIDLQQQLSAAMPNSLGEQVVDQVSILVAAANALSVPVVVTEQYPKGLGSTVFRLKSQLGDGVPIVEKTDFSAAAVEGFLNAITQTQRKQIILTGMEAHICIIQTAFDLQRQGYQVFVVEDGICSRSKSNKDNALERMRQAGIIITNVESIVFEWLGDAKHPDFKTLAQLII